MFITQGAAYYYFFLPAAVPIVVIAVIAFLHPAAHAIPALTRRAEGALRDRCFRARPPGLDGAGGGAPVRGIEGVTWYVRR